MTTHAAMSGTTREDTMSTRRTPTEMAQAALDTAQRKVERADPMIHCGRGICAAEEGHAGTCDEASGWAEEESDVRPVSPAQDAVSDAEAAEWARLAAEATEGPWVVDPDGSIGAPMAGFVCGEDGHPRLDCSECGTRVCHVNVIPGDPDAAFIAAAWAAVPRLLADRDRLKGERDRAIGFATRVEAENARMVEWNAITTRAFETTRRVLQEASGLPDDIDDPDCRDEMVLALRPRAEKAEAEVERMSAERDRARSLAARLEAENARLREGIESMMRDVGKAQPAHVTPGIVAVRLKALLAEDEGGE